MNLESSPEENGKCVPSIPIVQYILKTLADSLPRNLTYHGVAHTYEVLRDATLLGIEDNLPARELHLLQVAAAFHDAGFLEGRIEHEERGARLAEDAMRADGGYTEEELERVGRLIRDTKLVRDRAMLAQIPSSPLAGYLLDADLGNLGRSDFFEKVGLERQEVPVTSEADFWQNLLALISSKKWYSTAGRTRREDVWRQNLEAVRARAAEWGIG
jgi:predicted metal-dependent HD superfamily phosphohydrolase